MKRFPAWAVFSGERVVAEGIDEGSLVGFLEGVKNRQRKKH